MADDTRDIAIETRAEVRQLMRTVTELRDKVDELCDLAERAKGASMMLSLVRAHVVRRHRGGGVWAL